MTIGVLSPPPTTVHCYIHKRPILTPNVPKESHDLFRTNLRLILKSSVADSLDNIPRRKDISTFAIT